MKNHILSLFSTDNLRKTIILFAISALLNIVSLLVGIGDNIPMIAMFFAGIIFLFFEVLNPWKKVKPFTILAAVSLGILILDFIFPFINEGTAMFVGLVFLAGVFTGTICIFYPFKRLEASTIRGSISLNNRPWNFTYYHCPLAERNHYSRK